MAAIGFRLLGFGIAISLPAVFGSGVIGWLMSRWVWIVWLGGGIIGWVAGEMIMTDAALATAMGTAADRLHHVVPAVLAVALTLLGWWHARRTPGPHVHEA